MSKSDTPERKIIKLPEITRIEGHAAVVVDIDDNKNCSVQLQVFEGTRFFERIVIGHNFSELPHITSRVCAICSTGHILAACMAVEATIKDSKLSTEEQLFRELMHLGMIIESHATHVFALALPDFLGVRDLAEFATLHPKHFSAWMTLRGLGAAIQTVLGGRPFHPVTIQVGGFSRYPDHKELTELRTKLVACEQPALDICDFLLNLKPSFSRDTTPPFLALIPSGKTYGYFGSKVRCSDGWEADVCEYKQYLSERVVSYSHAKRAEVNGSPFMVGSMARLFLYNRLLTGHAKDFYQASPLVNGDYNTVWNNLAQSIEIVQAFQRSKAIIDALLGTDYQLVPKREQLRLSSPLTGTAAVECPRGTLYHSYTLSAEGQVLAADMITPSVQNSARIELDIAEVVRKSADYKSTELHAQLETLVRAYDPCNTCATHMVKVRFI